MFIPGPPLQPLVTYDSLNTFLADYQNLKNVKAGVAVYGSAAAYALVWELGSLRAKKPGPKTVWGTNRYGDRIIMSSQAPEGYVGIVEDQFWPIIEAELDKINFSQPVQALQVEMEVAFDNASIKIAQLIRSGAPADSGDLRSQIQAVNTDESDVLGKSIEIESIGTLII